MPLSIISPELSFLDFNTGLTVICNEEMDYPLPGFEEFSIKAQIRIDGDRLISDKLYVGICDVDCNTILDEDVELTPICSRYKLVSDFNFCDLPEETVINDEDFSTNPLNAINYVTGGFTFRVASLPDTDNEFIFYLDGKIFRFKRYNDTLNPYTLLTVGDVYYIFVSDQVGPDVSVDSFCGNLAEALNDIMDGAIGSTTVYTEIPNHEFAVFTAPADGFISDPYSILTGTPYASSDNTALGFIWNGVDETMCLNHFSGVDGPDSYSHQQELLIGLTYTYSLEYVSTYADFDINLKVNDGTNPEQIIPVIIPSGTGTAEVSFTTLLTGPHDIKLEVTDAAGHESGLCIDNIEIKTGVYINVTRSTPCSGIIPNPDYTPVTVGIYTSLESFYAMLSEVIGITLDSCEFTSCCEVPLIKFWIDGVGECGTEGDPGTLVELKQYWDWAYIDYPATQMEGVLNMYQCYKYCILDEPARHGHVKPVVECSNSFKRVPNDCYTSQLEYSCKENAFGFKYPSTEVTNKIRLPFYLRSPEYPKQEKIYRESGGDYRRLSAVIEKEYAGETDYVPEWIHDRLVAALNHDLVLVSNPNINSIDLQVTHAGAYDPDWKDPYEVAQAKFKVKKYFNGSNSNCKTNNACS